MNLSERVTVQCRTCSARFTTDRVTVAASWVYDHDPRHDLEVERVTYRQGMTAAEFVNIALRSVA